MMASPGALRTAGNNDNSPMASDTSIVSALKPKLPAMPQQLESMVSTVNPGTSLNAVSTAPMASKDFWWQWPCSKARSATGLRDKLRRPARVSRARNSSNNNTCSPRRRAEPSLAIAGISSRKPRMQLGSSPTTGTPRSTNGVTAAMTRSASRRASATLPTARNVRPQQSGRKPSVGAAMCTR